MRDGYNTKDAKHNVLHAALKNPRADRVTGSKLSRTLSFWLSRPLAQKDSILSKYVECNLRCIREDLRSENNRMSALQGTLFFNGPKLLSHLHPYFIARLTSVWRRLGLLISICWSTIGWTGADASDRLQTPVVTCSDSLVVTVLNLVSVLSLREFCKTTSALLLKQDSQVTFRGRLLMSENKLEEAFEIFDKACTSSRTCTAFLL